MEDWDAIAKFLGFECEREMYVELYTRQGFSISQIAHKLGVGTATIVRRLGEHNIVKRRKGGPNNDAKHKRRLFRADQRVVFSTSNEVLAKMFGIHSSTVYKFKRAMKEVRFGLRSDQPHSGTGTLRDVE